MMFKEVYLNYFNNKKEIEKQQEILEQLYLEKAELVQALERDEEKRKSITDEVQEAIKVKDKALKDLESIEKDTLERKEEIIKLAEENNSLKVKNESLLKEIENIKQHSNALLETYEKLSDFKTQFEEIKAQFEIKSENKNNNSTLKTNTQVFVKMIAEKSVEYNKRLKELIDNLDVGNIIKMQTDGIDSLNIEIKNLEEKYNSTNKELNQLKEEVEHLSTEKENILKEIQEHTTSNQHIFNFLKQGKEDESSNNTKIPSELKYYDYYVENQKLANIIKVFVDLHKIKHVYHYENKEDDLIDLILISGEKIPESRELLREFVEYELLQREYSRHINFLSSINIKNKTIEKALDDLFEEVSVSDIAGPHLTYQVHIGNDKYHVDLEINMAVLSLHFYLNDVEITYDSIKELGDIVLKRYRIYQIEQIVIKNNLRGE